MLAGRLRISETGADLQHDRRAAGAGVEDVGRELQLLVHESDEESPLRIETGLKRSGALGNAAELQPLHRTVSNLRPGVVEIARLRGRVEDVFIVDGEGQLLPGQRRLASGRDSVGAAEDAADHGSHRELPGLSPAEVVARPQRSGTKVL